MRTAKSITVTRNELVTALNKKDQFILAVVFHGEVSDRTPPGKGTKTAMIEEALAFPKKGNIFPDMGTQERTDEADALFGKVRKSLLSLLLLNPDCSYFFREIRDLLQTGSGAVHRELANLVDAGLVTLTKQANQTRYQANKESPVYEELHGFLKKTSGIPSQLTNALKEKQKEIELAFIYGSYASGEMRPNSDIDLMVIGNISFQALVETLLEVQEKSGREVNPTLYTIESFREKQETGFIQNVMESPRLYLIGGDDELEEAVR